MSGHRGVPGPYGTTIWLPIEDLYEIIIGEVRRKSPRGDNHTAFGAKQLRR